ncbi:MAG: CehA/McbA family metallohydrolase [Pseudomonadota bacterium]
MLDRWTDLPAAGWYSGDVHIHIEREREDNDTIMEFLKAEDVHVSNLLLATNTGERHFNQYAFGEEGIHQVATHAIVPGIEGPRTAQRGHIIALNIAEPIIDLKNYFHYHKFMQGYADQGGLSGYAHVGSEEFNASWGLALDVPFGLVDFVEVMQNSQLRTEIWYQFLGLGYQLAPAAGSDFPYFDQPGAIRNYARIDGDFSTEGWFDALRRGDTFVTNGPVLELLVNGEPPGASLSIAATEALDVVAHASINPDLDELASLELVYCGETIASTDKSSAPTYALALASQLEANQGGWLALKVTGKSYAMAHSAPVYIQDENGSSACQAQVDELAELMLDRLAALQNTRPDQQRELEYWETANVHALYNAQLPALTARIEQAAAIYREMIVKTPVR